MLRVPCQARREEEDQLAREAREACEVVRTRLGIQRRARGAKGAIPEDEEVAAGAGGAESDDEMELVAEVVDDPETNRWARAGIVPLSPAEEYSISLTDF